MDMKVSGSSHIGPGEYEHIRISGSGKLEGPIRCKTLHCGGSVHGAGDLEVCEDISIAGSAHMDGHVHARDLSISGSGTVGGHCIVRHEIKISGSFRCDGDLKADQLRLGGTVRAANMEAEEARVAGAITCPGLLNAEIVEIKIDNADSHIGSIGGTVICIGRKVHNATEKHLFFRRSGRHGQAQITDAIEGEEITLDHVTAPTVIGRTVRIGPGCRIGEVQYSESLDIAPDATVESQTRM